MLSLSTSAATGAKAPLHLEKITTVDRDAW
jgi:hypothetical protein